MGTRQYRYQHLDVFTDRRFGGNQLAVFPEADGLAAETCQKIAREIGFSESTFVFQAEGPHSDVRLRIFTPTLEMPMAGHPVIGSTFALARAGRIASSRADWTFGLNIGPLLVDLEWEQEELGFVWMTQRTPLFGRIVAETGMVARALGLSEDDVREAGLPVQEVSCGIKFVIVPLATRDAIDRAIPDAAALGELSRRIMGDDLLAVYLFTMDDGSSTDGATVYTRMFAPDFGILEDPATGSASGPLGCYLVHHSLIRPDEARSIVNVQGVRMGRPSAIHVAIDSSDGVITRVRVGGKSVLVAEGVMTVDSR
jgi:trans-2,3-dihydro-3-hydroxyanthranilate isomerase